MTVQIFMILLTTLSIITSLITEAVKKLLDASGEQYACNIVVLLIAVIVGGTGTCIFYVFNAMPFDLINSICIALMTLANWLVAMLGYDKVMQAIAQIKG